ncbi:hypothetical protein BH11ARM1_BH11ARM1_14920 [soil metagenome]
MSTYLASFSSLNLAKKYAAELLMARVASDDISIVSREYGMSSEIHNSDATTFVGRTDDPDANPRFGDNLTRTSAMTTTAESPIGGIDTSNSDTDVDSVDQAEESQSLAEDQTYPNHGISYGEHQGDTAALSVLTGFPTDVPVIDKGPQTGPIDIDLDVTTFVNLGTSMGGGALATLGLDLIRRQETESARTVLEFLKGEGVSDEYAADFLEKFRNGEAITAVEITPGHSPEATIERLARESGATDGQLFDAPRFHEGAGSNGYLA